MFELSKSEFFEFNIGSRCSLLALDGILLCSKALSGSFILKVYSIYGFQVQTTTDHRTAAVIDVIPVELEYIGQYYFN